MRFIGIAELSLAGVRVQLRRRHSLALLAYLVLTARPHSREELATVLAGEVTDDPARKLLRNALADLNERGLGDFLLTSRHAVAFNYEAPHSCDVGRLDALQAAGATADPEALAWAAARCDMELLAGLAVRDAPNFEAWLTREREYRRQQLLQLAQQLLEQHLRADQTTQAIELTRRLLIAEPWQEDLHCQLMRLLARDGRLSAALEQYELCRRDLAEELGVEPQPETTALYERLRAGPRPPRNNLPNNIGELSAGLFGREADLDAVAQNLVEPDCRLLTLVGLGGNGKTSLALAAAARLTAPAAVAEDHPFANGIVLVSLADVGGAAPDAVGQDIATAIGLGLGLAFYGNIDRLDQLTAYLASKRLLLILDNLDQPALSAPTLQVILRRAQGVTMLVTSRSLLGIPEEWTRFVAGLGLPSSPQELEQAPAGRLFLHEARRAHASLGPADAPHIVRICELAGGSPLALKIAAGWLHTVPCAEIAGQLASGGELLDDATFAQAEQRTSLRTLLNSVWADLPDQEQLALRRLAVFPARFDQQAAQAVGVTLPQLAALRRRSLLERGADDGYALHPLVRQQAGAHLARHPAEEAQVRAAHAGYYTGFTARHAPALRERREAHATFDAEIPNLRAAWTWAVAQGDVALLSTLWQGLATWNQLAGLHREWAETLANSVALLAALPAADDDPDLRTLLGWLLLAQADTLQWQGEPDQAARALAAARRYATTTDSAALIARMYLREGRLLQLQGHAGAAIALLRRSHAYAGDADDPRLVAHTLLSLSYSLADNGDYSEAETFVHRARELYRAIGDRLSLGRTTLHAGHLHAAWGDYGRARALLEQSLHIHREFHDRPSEMLAHAYLGTVFGDGLGRHHDARLHISLALGIAQEMRDRNAEAVVQCVQGRNELQVGDFNRAAACFEFALSAGRSLGSPAIESRALHGLGQLALAAADAGRAEDCAEQALRSATDAERRREQALACLLLGRARDRLGRSADAAQAYERARAFAEALELPYLYGDATAGLANAALAAGSLDLALRLAGELAPYLHECLLSGSSAPGWVALSCYRVLLAAGDERANDILRQGATILERRAAALPRQQRARYLEAFPARRAVLQLWVEHQAAGRVADLAPPPLPVEPPALRPPEPGAPGHSARAACQTAVANASQSLSDQPDQG